MQTSDCHGEVGFGSLLIIIQSFSYRGGTVEGAGGDIFVKDSELHVHYYWIIISLYTARLLARLRRRFFLAAKQTSNFTLGLVDKVVMIVTTFRSGLLCLAFFFLGLLPLLVIFPLEG